MPRRGSRSRKAISVMFMTFIAISILTAVFLTMYLYLIRTHTMASEAERIYAEAAQERLVAIYRSSSEELTIKNVGGIGINLKYLVEMEDNSALITDFSELLDDTFLSSNESVTLFYHKNNPGNQLLILTERGSLFLVKPPEGFTVQILPSKESIEIPPGGSVSVEFRVAVSETYPGWPIRLTAFPSNCSIEKPFSGLLQCGECDIWELPWGRYLVCQDCEAGTDLPLYLNFIDRIELSENLLSVEPGSRSQPITLTIYVDPEAEPGTECYIWIKALNASNGFELASAGLRVEISS